MENDLNTALAVSLVQNKPVGMDVVDYVTGIQSKIMEKETELFFQVRLYKITIFCNIEGNVKNLNLSLDYYLNIARHDFSAKGIFQFFSYNLYLCENIVF